MMIVNAATTAATVQAHRGEEAEKERERRLCEFATNCSLKELQDALDKGLSPNATTRIEYFPSTLINDAAAAGSVEKVRLLASRGASVGVLDDSARSPLSAAVRSEKKGAIDVVKELIRLGANVNEADVYGTTAVHSAALDNPEACALLADAGASLDIQDSHGMTPLHLAAKRNRGDICALLIERGANALSRDAIGRTPLHYAVRFGAADAIEALVQGGADPLAKDDWGRPTTRGIGRDPIQENRTAEGRGHLMRAVAELRPEMQAQLSQNDSFPGRLKSFLEASRQKILPSDSAKAKGPAV
jgi:ankyrin repeat protein